MVRKNVQKTMFDSTLANQKTGKTVEEPLKELPWNQQIVFLDLHTILSPY